MRGDVGVQLDDRPHAPRRWGPRAAYWAEAIIPRGVGLIFLWAGLTKAWDGSKIHRVFAFNGLPQPLIVPMTHVVWIAEVILAVVLLLGIARRRAMVTAIMVLFVYSLQLAYLIVADNPPEDCGCVALLAKYASAKQAMVLGLVRNAAMAACLEWVRLRIVSRKLAAEDAHNFGGAMQKDG